MSGGGGVEKKFLVPTYSFFFFRGIPRRRGGGVRKKICAQFFSGPQNLKFPQLYPTSLGLFRVSENPNLQIGATKPEPFLENGRTNDAQLAKVAREKQRTVPLISWWTLDGRCHSLAHLLDTMIRRRAAMLGRHKEHADAGVYLR